MDEGARFCPVRGSKQRPKNRWFSRVKFAYPSREFRLRIAAEKAALSRTLLGKAGPSFMRANRQLNPIPLDKGGLLRSHPFFKGLDDRIVERLIPHALTRKVKNGTLLFRKGDAGTNLYAVCAGAVRVSAPSDRGKDAVFNLIVPGEIFGEIAFLDGGPRTADAMI